MCSNYASQSQSLAKLYSDRLLANLGSLISLILLSYHAMTPLNDEEEDRQSV